MRHATRFRLRTPRASDDMPIGPCPASFANLELWFDASTIKNLADGTAVAQWDDLSGNNRHLTQATEASRPLYKAKGLNGLPALKFDGVNDFMNCDAFSFTAITLFMVIHSGDLITDNIVLFSFNPASGSSWNNADGIVMGNWAGANFTGELLRYVGANQLVLRPPLADTPFILTFQLDGAGNGKIRVNGTETTDTYSDLTSIDPSKFSLATGEISGGGYGRNYYSEIIVYSTALSSEEILAMEYSLNKKWRIG